MKSETQSKIYNFQRCAVKQCSNKSGFTLSELLVVMAVMMVLAVMTVPATKALMKSFETSAGVRTLISAALCNARAIAAKEQRYAGVRFQQDLKGNQYMIFIIHDPLDPASTANGIGTGLAYGFRAIEGKKPIKLPANIGVMDLHIRLDLVDPTNPADQAIAADGDIDGAAEVMDATTFSIVFSPVGKLVVHEVRVRNRTGRIDDSSSDDIFNTDLNVDADAGRGMFYQDDYANLGLGQERSRKWFVIYDKKAFDAVRTSQRWSDYLTDLDKVYVNPRTGEVINY